MACIWAHFQGSKTFWIRAHRPGGSRSSLFGLAAAFLLSLLPGIGFPDDLPSFLNQGSTFPLQIDLVEELQYHGSDGPVGDPLSSFRTLAVRVTLDCRVIKTGSRGARIEATAKSGNLALEIRGREIVDPIRWECPVEGVRLGAEVVRGRTRVIIEPSSWDRNYRGWRRGLRREEEPRAKSLTSEGLKGLLADAVAAALEVQLGLCGFRKRQGTLFTLRRSLEPLEDGPAGRIELMLHRDHVLRWGEAFSGELSLIFTGRQGDKVTPDPNFARESLHLGSTRKREWKPRLPSPLWVRHIDWKEARGGNPPFLRMTLDMQHQDPGALNQKDENSTYRLRFTAGPRKMEWAEAPLSARALPDQLGSPWPSTAEKEKLLAFHLRKANWTFWNLAGGLKRADPKVDEVLESYARIEQEGVGKGVDRARLHFLLAARLARVAYQADHAGARAWVERTIKDEKRLAPFVLALRVVSDPFSFLTDSERVALLKAAAMRREPGLARWGGMFLGWGFDGAGEAIVEVLLDREAQLTLDPELERSLWVDLNRAAGERAQELYEKQKEIWEKRKDIASHRKKEARGPTVVLGSSGGKNVRSSIQAERKLLGLRRLVFVISVGIGMKDIAASKPYGPSYWIRLLARAKSYCAGKLKALHSGQLFSILAYHSHVVPWSRTLQKADGNTTRKAIAFVQNLSLFPKREPSPDLTYALNGYGRLDGIVLMNPGSTLTTESLYLWNYLRGTRFLLVDKYPEYSIFTGARRSLMGEFNHGWYDTIYDTSEDPPELKKGNLQKR